MSVLTCIAKIQAKAGAEEQVKQALSKLLEKTFLQSVIYLS